MVTLGKRNEFKGKDINVIFTSNHKILKIIAHLL